MCALADLLSILIMAYLWVVFAAAILSWFNPDPKHPLVRIIYRVTDPLFQKVRRTITTDSNGIDFSPLIVAFALLILRYLIVGALRSIGHC